MTRRFGLIGRNIGYSFSRGYFTKKFEETGLDASYENFDIPEIGEVTSILESGVSGLNVTIPYKEAILPYLDGLSENATKIGAVNTISFQNGKAIGHNTDYIGCTESLHPLLLPHHKKALVLGTGGASKAVVYALDKLGIPSLLVSREPKAGAISYDELTAEILSTHHIIVNTTPLGTSPNTEAFPPVPYQFVTPLHLAYDLVYNPERTVFLQKAQEQGATIKNGHEMLVLQAEAAWNIWNS